IDDVEGAAFVAADEGAAAAAEELDLLGAAAHGDGVLAADGAGREPLERDDLVLGAEDDVAHGAVGRHEDADGVAEHRCADAVLRGRETAWIEGVRGTALRVAQAGEGDGAGRREGALAAVVDADGTDRVVAELD